MNDLVDTTEMYLRTIVNLEEEGISPIIKARISERIGHTAPTVFQTIARMQRDGLLVVSSNKSLILTSREGKSRFPLYANIAWRRFFYMTW